jgi:hypothetical protein
MTKETEVITGIVSELKVINTRTGTNMVTFVLGGKRCKAFGDMAATLQTSNDEQVEITARRGTYLGKPEYAVVSVKATVEGRNVSVSDIHTVATLPKQDLKHVNRYRWNLQSYGSDAKARAVGMWLNEFFDSLTEEEWFQWQTYRDSRWPKTDAENEEISRIDEEIACANEIKLTEQKDHRPYNMELEDRILELHNKRSRVVATSGSESVKARCNARLDVVRGHLKCRTRAQAPVLAARTPATATSAEAPRSRTAEDPPTGPSHLPPTRASLPADDFAPAKRVTFEDLENQYKSQKMAREMENLGQQSMKA